MDTQRIEERLNLTGKTAMLTGGGTVIGRAIAEALADTGAAIVLIADQNIEEASETVHRIQAEEGRARLLQADPDEPADAERVAQAAIELFGRLDILVNNSLSLPFATSPSSLAAAWRNALKASVRSVDLYGRAAAQKMIQAGEGGRIVNIAWMADPAAYERPLRPESNVATVSKLLSVELAPFRINVNALAPGMIQIAQTQMQLASLPGSKRMPNGEGETPASSRLSSVPIAEPEDIATVVLFLLSPAADAITGQLVVVDGDYRAARG